tara:strand:- start:51 stop:650 length:600 start_codon:yes stop_codon:yes gene_type:complete
MKILLYGSAHLASIACDLLKKHYDVVGHIPSKRPRIPGIMNCKTIDNESTCDHDIKLSIQYDQKIADVENCYNVHTGLLPEWGGCDILYHTLQNNAQEQGVTFHKMTDKFDYGPIISKVTYPVVKGDTVITLYERLTAIVPWFVLSSLQLLETLSLDQISACHKEKPSIFKKEKEIKEMDLNEYRKNGNILKELYGSTK